MEWISAVSEVGIPFVSFLLAAYFIKYSYDKSFDANKEAITTVGSLAEAVNNNTEILLRLFEEVEDDKK